MLIRTDNTLISNREALIALIAVAMQSVVTIPLQAARRLFRKR